MEKKFEIKHLLRYTFKYKKDFIIAVLANILFSLIVLGYAEMFRIFFDNAQKGIIEGIYRNLLILFSFLCFQGILHYISSRYTKILYLKIKKQLQYESIFKVVDGYILETNKLHGGEWMNISLNDTEQIANLGSNILIRAIHIIIKTVIFIIYLFTINFSLAIIAILFSPLMLLLGKLFTSSIKSKSKKYSEEKANLTSNISEIFQKSMLFKLNPSKKFLNNKVNGLLKENYISENKLDKVSQKYVELSSVLGQAGNVIILSIGAYLIAKKEMTTGTLVAFMQIMNQIIWTLDSLSNIYGTYSNVKAKFERLDLINNLTLDMSDVTKEQIDALIKVDKMSFEIGENKIFNDISFDIFKGEWICIVGENGIGKTTLLNLLSGLYKPTEGEIIYNKDIFKLNDETLSDVVTYAQQSNGLFMGSIKENITFDSMDINEIDLIKLLDEFELLNELPNGINSKFQQGGNNYSGGQKQKLSLARLLLSKNDIIFLDEPLSAIDPDNKIKLMKRIMDFVSKKTCISIDHNFQFVKNVDKVLFIENENQICLSTHIELYRTNNNYRKLYETVVENKNKEVI